MNKATLLTPKTKRVIHCIGIGGFGLSALAGLLRAQGHTITGSDQHESPLLKRLREKKVNIHISQQQNHLPKKTEIVIFSEAVPKNNPELKEARKRRLLSLTYFEAVGLLSQRYRNVIAVAGTNGKTTTTAMIAWIFHKAKMSPTAIIGSPLNNTGKNYMVGGTDIFIIEACEYRRNFLSLRPTDIILTNIEADHLDYFRNMNDIRRAFQQFINNLQPNGRLFLNADDPLTRTKIQKSGKKVVWYSRKNTQADFMAKKIEIAHGINRFELKIKKQKTIEPIQLQIPGTFNVSNALAAIAIAHSYGIPIQVIRSALQSFKSTWRRFQKLPDWKNTTVISDYAHHPSAIRETLEAAKIFYPKRRLVTIFQPHQHSRTKKLFKEFIQALEHSDLIILPEIYGVAGREKKEDQNISSLDLGKKLGKKKPTYYAKNLTETKNCLKKMIKKHDVLLFMGAGDIFQLAESLAYES